MQPTACPGRLVGPVPVRAHGLGHGLRVQTRGPHGGLTGRMRVYTQLWEGAQSVPVPVGVPPCLCVWLTCGTQQLPAHPTPSRGTQLEQTQVSATLGRKQGARLPRELIKGDLASEGETWAGGEPGGKARSRAWTRSPAGLSAPPEHFTH